MTILITGGHGLIGSALTEHLRALGHRVRIASRSAQGADTISWSPRDQEINMRDGEAIDAMIHLAGENIAQGRWTAAKKRRILESRRLGTRTIARAAAAQERKPRVLISASGVNYYPANTGRVMREDSAPGEDFLSEVCQVWESETDLARDAGIRVVNARLGVVLTPKGGALARLRPLFKMGLGGRLGSGRQRMSWVSLEDVVGVMSQALHDERYSGPINTVAPQIVTNAEFTRTLAHALNRWTFLPAPAAALKILLGQMAEETLLADLAVEPAALQDLGYEWIHPRLDEALEAMEAMEA